MIPRRISTRLTRGQSPARLDVDVKAGAHTIYMVYWHDLWKTGAINMAVGQGVEVVPFRARMGIHADVQPYPVHCP